MLHAAGIVTYYPDSSRLINSLNRLISQVEVVYIFDNTPKDNIIVPQLLLENKFTNVAYFPNEFNIGLAKALNQLCEKARYDGYEWLLLLDQDSLISENFLLKLEKYTSVPLVGLLCPTVVEEYFNICHGYNILNDLNENEIEEVEAAITSGSLVNLKCHEIVGGFYEDFFIDNIDNDYSRLLIHNGFKIYWIKENCIFHEYGDSETTLFSQIFLNMTKINRPFFIRRNYSSLRVYYQFRNSVLLYRRWSIVRKAFFTKTLRYLLGLLIQFIRLMLIEKKRLRNLKYVTKGIIDGLTYNVKKVEAK